MTSLNYQFRRAQPRLKTQNAASGATPARPRFAPELAGEDVKSNRQRWLAYQAKLAAQEAA